MFELDMPSYEDYEAEQERRRRMRKRQAHEYDIADEREDRKDEHIV